MLFIVVLSQVTHFCIHTGHIMQDKCGRRGNTLPGGSQCGWEIVKEEFTVNGLNGGGF